MLYIPPLHSYLLNYPSNIWCRVQVKNLLIYTGRKHSCTGSHSVIPCYKRRCKFYTSCVLRLLVFEAHITVKWRKIPYDQTVGVGYLRVK